MAAGKSKWTTVGSLRKGKEGNLYIKMTADVVLKKDMAVRLQDPRKKNVTLAEKGFISMEEAEKRNTNIPEYVKYDVVLVTDAE